MGYMGFGMQRWIYKQRPRQPFAGIRKNTFAVSNYTIRPATTNNYIYLIRFGLVIALIAASIFIPDQYGAVLENRITQKKENNIRSNNEAFIFLMESGINRFQNNNYESALKEFNLAHAIYPNHIQLNQLRYETISLLCYKQGKYCDGLDSFTLVDE